MDKRGQVSIFVIIAIVIVVAAVGIFYVYPKISGSSISTSPTQFIQNCLDDEIEDQVEQVFLNGGSSKPEFYSEYYSNGKKYEIEYLCYTNEYYKQCVMQKPLLKSHIEGEIKKAISEKVKSCFGTLENNYKKQGYSVDLKQNDYNVEIFSGKIRTTFDYDLSLTKDATDRYEEFVVDVKSDYYRLINIANSILLWEAQYGDADISGHMDANYWLKAEKRKLTDGTKIYILTDKESGGKFMFASRSVVWPPGYGARTPIGFLRLIFPL